MKSGDECALTGQKNFFFVLTKILKFCDSWYIYIVVCVVILYASLTLLAVPSEPTDSISPPSSYTRIHKVDQLVCYKTVVVMYIPTVYWPFYKSIDNLDLNTYISWKLAEL